MPDEVKLEKRSDEKFCSECGAVIRAKAEICPKCGVRQFAAPLAPPSAPAPMPNGRTKTTAGLLAIFLGGFGVHKFYLGRSVQGLFYLIFCWTFVPAILGFVEGLVYFSMSDQAFAEKYGIAPRTTQARPLAASSPGPPHDLHNNVSYKVGRAVNRSPLLKFLVWGLGIFIGLFVLGSIIKQIRDSPASDASNSTSISNSTFSASGDASNDADFLIARCGQPSSDDSTANDNPRPPIPARIIEYQKPRLRFMFIPGGDSHLGDAPPYKWKLVGITDMTVADPSQATVVKPSEAAARMPCWSGN